MRLGGWVFVWAVGCGSPDAPVDPQDTDLRVFEVPAGASANRLTDRLVAEGLVPSALRWKLFLRGVDASCVKKGRFQVRGAMSMRELLTTLCGPPMVEDEPFTVVEGWRARDIDAALVERGWIEPGAFLAVVQNKAVQAPFDVSSPSYEGYLYPETYRVVPDRFRVEDFVSRQLRTFQERFLVEHEAEVAERGLHAVVVMASMLEREEPTPAQRNVVAGILWKRLDNGWKLGVDATSRYTLDAWNDRKAFLKQLRDPADPYNTRLREGLPPTAIGNPGVVSLKAAVAPEASPYWYYLHDGTGRFHGGRNAAEHEANRKTYNVY